jgi:DNA recombination protein RmuC
MSINIILLLLITTLAFAALCFAYLSYAKYKQATATDFNLQQDLQSWRAEQLELQRESQFSGLKSQQDSLNQGFSLLQSQVANSLKQHGDFLGERFAALRQETSERLKDISGQVDQRLQASFEKTTSTFTDVIKRLTIIDEAQKRITELSSNVASLQDILTDKRSRGAFGEVQLEGLVRNMLPENNFSFQHTFANAKRADCVLFLPEPSGNIAVDAKFPLESYRALTSDAITPAQRSVAETQFKQDIKKHIKDIASKYIIPGETGDGAVMFIPAEAIFAYIHSHCQSVVEFSQRERVWMVSPTTMMAILTTARAVIKDSATRKQVHLIQAHIGKLAEDFTRFEQRMDNLARHINQTQKDVTEIHKSSKKISDRFGKIENVELDETPALIKE